MAQQLINIGTVANDGTGQTLRSAFQVINQNFTDIYSIATTANQINNNSNLTLTPPEQNTQIYSTTSLTQTITIPNSANVTFPIATQLTVLFNGTGSVILQPQSGVTLHWAGNTAIGSRTLTSPAIATLICTEPDVWIVTGAGIS
jgi:hypothetical protein